jgi:DNA replication protein DnaC
MMSERVREEKICPEHGAYMALGGSIGGGPILWSSCPECLKRYEQEQSRIVDAASLARVSEKLEAIGIPERIRYASLDFIKGKHVEEKRQIAKEVLSGASAIIYGEVGTGKTYFACAILNAKGEGLYSTAYKLSMRIRSTYNREAGETELDVFEKLTETPLLVIDEVGRTKGSEHEYQWLSHVIDSRYGSMLPTILITNAHYSGDCKEGGNCPACVDNYVSKNIMSRILDGGVLCNFSGEDRRLA